MWHWKVQKQKIKITMIYISYKNLLTKEWPEHSPSHILRFNLIFKIRMQSLEFDSNDRPTELAAKTTMQYPSTSTSAVSFQSIAQTSYQPFQPPHSDGLGINQLRFTKFTKKIFPFTSFFPFFSENFSYPKVSFLLFVFFLTPSTLT